MLFRSVVEPAHLASLLCAEPDAGSHPSGGNQRLYEPSTGCFRVHGDLTLPHKRNETMSDTFLIVAVTGKVLRQKPFLLEHPPNQSITMACTASDRQAFTLSWLGGHSQVPSANVMPGVAAVPCSPTVRWAAWSAARGHRSRGRASRAGKLPAARTLTVPARLSGCSVLGHPWHAPTLLLSAPRTTMKRSRAEESLRAISRPMRRHAIHVRGIDIPDPR